jgi:polyisoprenoid-binding protein YceI
VAISFVARGDLTLHGVTRSVDVPIQAATTDGKLIVVGATEIALADFEIDAPSAPLVASVSDVATMELSLLFTRP